jgi:hypothetical protein
MKNEKAPPRITPFGMPLRNVMVNSRVQVSCVIEEGDPPFRIRWFRDDRPLLHHHVASSSASAVGLGTDPPSMVRLPPVQSGLRLTDFNSYSSILTIDQVLPNFVFIFPAFFFLIRIYSPPSLLTCTKQLKLGDCQSRRQLLVPRFERRWHGRSRHFAPSQR